MRQALNVQVPVESMNSDSFGISPPLHQLASTNMYNIIPHNWYFSPDTSLYFIFHIGNILCTSVIYLFGVYVTFNTVQVISQQVVGRAEETSTYSSLGFCTVNCQTTASNYQFSHFRPCGDRTLASEVGGECYHSATVAFLQV